MKDGCFARVFWGDITKAARKMLGKRISEEREQNVLDKPSMHVLDAGQSEGKVRKFWPLDISEE